MTVETAANALPFHETVKEPLEAILVAVRGDLLAHRNNDYPNEAVGILTADGTAYPLINQARSPKRFEVSQQLVAEAINHLKYRNHLPIAVYHSHPEADSGPSERDQMMMREMPQSTFVIIGNDGIAAWMWDEELRFVLHIPLKDECEHIPLKGE